MKFFQNLIIDIEKMSFKVVFFLFLALVAILFSRAKNLNNFARGPPKEHLCEMTLNLGLLVRRRCRLKVFVF